MNSKEVKEILAKVLEIDIATIFDNATQKDIAKWDSLQHLNLIVEIFLYRYNKNVFKKIAMRHAQNWTRLEGCGGGKSECKSVHQSISETQKMLCGCNCSYIIFFSPLIFLCIQR